ncbi:pyridoxamine 5'-phosphate oxidase family protein [Pseudogracilibacillus sp. SO30301A]|uniref:pyridoxamine 5'-phosphate oxidase family protein n=1 Tax=Pseudogracilibacillus sp. SO30301A TaxID=3098291 RepID=UPI00300DD5CB
MAKKIDVEKYKKMYKVFLNKKHTAVISMKDRQGNPFISCAPFILKDNAFYIYISEVAEHHNYLVNNEQVDVMLLADEAETMNPFATERIRFRCEPKAVVDNEDIFVAFDEQFNPSLMGMLRKLDFTIFKLSPVSGRYVVGFGLAFDTNIEGSSFRHVTVDKDNKEGQLN